MSDPDLPPPERCANNLHRAPDRASAAPEATDLCRNALGVVHMLDCPLFLGRRCGQYEEAPAPHPVVPDAEILAAREELQRDFLGWPYRQRVRNLAKPRDLVAKRIALEVAPTVAEPDDVPLVLRVPLPAEVSEGAPAADAAAPAPAPLPAPEPAPADASAPAPPPAVEYYPGPRRSEDRGKRKRLAPRPAAAALPPVAETDPGIDGEVEFGGGIEGAPDEAWEPSTPSPPPGPKTVEQLLEILPEAALPAQPPEGARGPRGDGRGGHGGRGRGRRGGPRGPGGPRPGPRREAPHGAPPDGAPRGPDRSAEGGGRPRDGGPGGRRFRRRGRGPRGPGGGPPPSPPAAP